MATAQFGIFAVGTPSHCYLEFAIRDGVDPQDLVRAVADIEAPHSTVGGVNIVVGVRPTIWAHLAPAEAASPARDFETPIVGPDGFTMPATQRDAFVWIAGAASDIVFDVAVDVQRALSQVATLALEVTGWSYRHSRDLTGFEDGTENPPLSDAADVVLIPAGQPGEGSSVVLLQKWVHDPVAWNALDDKAQEAVMGRTKRDSIELDDDVKPADSHVARNVIENDAGEELDIFRRNTPYGTLSDHGTMFIGFSFEPARMQRMLERMAGAEDGIRDALTRYTTPLTGSYYVIPSVEALRPFATPEADD